MHPWHLHRRLHDKRQCSAKDQYGNAVITGRFTAALASNGARAVTVSETATLGTPSHDEPHVSSVYDSANTAATLAFTVQIGGTNAAEPTEPHCSARRRGRVAEQRHVDPEHQHGSEFTLRDSYGKLEAGPDAASHLTDAGVHLAFVWLIALPGARPQGQRRDQLPHDGHRG